MNEREQVELVRAAGWELVTGEHAHYWTKGEQQVSLARAVQIETGLDRVSVIAHWLADRPQTPPVVVTSEAGVENYRADGWRVTGPYVPADQLTGAVEERDKLAAYLLWTFDPDEGRAPMSFTEMRALLDRIGGQ